jgi:hypothetical protein
MMVAVGPCRLAPHIVCSPYRPPRWLERVDHRPVMIRGTAGAQRVADRESNTAV